MLRQRLVRQGALSTSSSGDLPTDSCFSLPSPSGTFHQLSSDSLDNLLDLTGPKSGKKNSAGKRRHSVACGAVVIDVQKNPFRSALNSAVRRMSSACSFLPSGSSSQPSLNNMEAIEQKDEKVILPSVLNTFRRGLPPKPRSKSPIDINRRFSSDFPPPTYQEATLLHKKFCTAAEADSFKQALFKRQESDSSSEPDTPDLHE